MIENTLIGTLYKVDGTHFAEGKSGNLYEVVERNITFSELHIEGLVLGDWCYALSRQWGVKKDGEKPGWHDFMAPNQDQHRFLLVSKDHCHWGIFVSQGANLEFVQKGLKWLRMYGEEPFIDDDDPDTYHYETTITEDGFELDACKKVKNE
jgi:hypothetical protein